MAATPKLDRIDINILAQLQRNGRLTNLRLAEAVGLSPSPCLSRVKRLEKAGYIAGYNARLQLSRLVEHITVFTEVTLLDHRREDFLKFESSIRRCGALKECHLVSGGYDCLLKFVVRNIDRYQAMMEAMLESDIGVEKYFSYVVLKTVIDLESVPLASLIEDG